MRKLDPGLTGAVFAVLLVIAQAFSASASVAATLLAENFDDGGGINSIFNFTNSSGQAPSMMGGGPTGNFARLTNLSTGNNNSLAFDLVPGSLSPGFTIYVDFRMSDDATAVGAGSGFGQAADGLGIGLFDAGLFPATGPLNPLSIWEDPRIDAQVGSVMMGFDIFSFSAFGGNNVRMTGLSGNEELLADLTSPFTLNSDELSPGTMELCRCRPQRSYVAEPRRGRERDCNNAPTAGGHSRAGSRSRHLQWSPHPGWTYRRGLRQW